MSKYDTIKTARDLIFEVASHGLSLDQDDLNRAADIFGRASIKELAALANNANCRDENGYTTGKPATADTFYFIAFNIWNWREAAAFFNEHTNPVTKDAKETSKRLAEETKRKESALAERDEIKKNLNDVHALYTEEQNKRIAGEHALEAAQQEIIALKAKLYDMIAAKD